jgi:NADH:ubiquinone oxidoreductase subunit 6 (subunit J)
MISATLIVVSLILGYVIAVGLSMMFVFGVVRIWPSLVRQNHRLTGIYLLLQDVVWFVIAAVAGYAASWVAAESSTPWVGAALLGVVLVVAMWRNIEEVMQRGLIHMLLASGCVLAGVAAGFWLHLF